MSSINKIFCSIVVDGQERLFGTLAELGRAVRKLPNSHYPENRQAEKRIHEADERRSYPEALVSALKEVIETRCKELGFDGSAYLQELEIVIDPTNLSHLEDRVERTPSALRALLKDSKESTSTLLISPISATERKSEKGADLTAAFLQAISADKTINRTILFPTKKDATQFWRSIFWKGVELSSANDASNRLLGRNWIQGSVPLPDDPKEEIDELLKFREESDELKILEVDYKFCLSPIILFKIKSGAVGYWLYHDDKGKIQTHRIPKKHIALWEVFYDDVVFNRIESNRNLWKDVREEIMKGY